MSEPSPTPAITVVTPEEARAIAREAYVYGFPMVDSYRIQHAYFINRESPEYKAAYNVLVNMPRVYTAEDKAVQTPNSDTPYSMVGVDLRTEPIVLTVPAIEGERYFSIQLVDLYTHNFAYIGSRATGNTGGSFLIAGPNWQGDVPPGITSVMRSETESVLAIYRTQLYEPADLDNVKQIQAGYRADTLSAFLGQPAPPAHPPLTFPTPLRPDEQKTSLAFFGILNFVLGFCPTHPSETDLMARFARLGIGAGLSFDPAVLAPELAAAVRAGMADAWAELTAFQHAEVDTGKVTSGDMFGTREYLKNNYLYRFAAAVLGIYGNSQQEAMYPIYRTDADGQPLDALQHRYELRFAPGQLPPVNAFWSLTMYSVPESLLVANPLNRYLINSPMLPRLQRDADGGLTLYLQCESPDGEQAANWLPAPNGPFMTVLRLYWPKDEALNGHWMPPTVQRLPRAPGKT